MIAKNFYFFIFFKFLLVMLLPHFNSSFRKVIVPAVYHEWRNNSTPNWATNRTLMKENGYEVFAYQKLDPRAPNFLATNRGSESNHLYYLFKSTYH